MADHLSSEHQHGTMDIRAHEKTYEGFIRFTSRSVGVILVALVFLALIGA